MQNSVERDSRVMRSIWKHAPAIFSRRASSQECLLDKRTESDSTLNQGATEFAVTSAEIGRYLEDGKFTAAVDLLHGLSPDYVQNCLESFPFKMLNRRVPKSFPVWEMLLMKLQCNDEGGSFNFPTTAWNDLVLKIGQSLVRAGSIPDVDLIHDCKRVLKKVYVLYNGVITQLVKEKEQIEYALYSLSLHLPLGTDNSAVSLHTAIKTEIEACISDYTESLKKISEIEEKQTFQLFQLGSEIHQNGHTSSPDEDGRVVEFHALNPNQIQLQERLYCNQSILRALEPNERKGNLPQLIEMLKGRIVGDKEAIALFGRIRQRNKSVLQTHTVEPCLRKYQQAVRSSLAMLRDIEKEMQPSVVHQPPSPTEVESESSSSLEDGGNELLSVPTLQLKSEENFHNRQPSLRRGSAAIPVLFNIGEKGMEEEDMEKMNRRYSVPPPNKPQRPRSTSPMKFLRGAIHGAVHGSNGVTHNGAAAASGVDNNSSCKSLNSSRSSCRSLNSSSIQELNTSPGGEPFRRAQSLKAKGCHDVRVSTPPRPHRLHVLPNGSRKSEPHRLSSSNLATTTPTQDSSKPSKLKNLFRSGSGGLVARCDTQQHKDDWCNGRSDSEFLLKLELKNKELIRRERIILDLERTVKELTDRLSEQAQRQLQDSEKFEDILLGPSRATVVIHRYEELYSQARMEALDALDGLQSSWSQDSSTAVSTDNTQLLLEILKIAYHCSWRYLQVLHHSWRELLGVPVPSREPTPEKYVHSDKSSSGGEGEGEEEEEVDTEGEEGEGGGLMGVHQSAEKQLESAISVYLRRVCRHQDLSPIIKMVESQLDAKYSDQVLYAEVKHLEAFVDYVEECVKVAWGLCIQTPHMTIDCSEAVYNPEHHKRFYRANKKKTDITKYMWPTLAQYRGCVLSRGTVMT